MEFLHIGKEIPKIDGEAKATGKLRYMTDLKFEGVLVAKVLRAKYPHAIIKEINVEEAIQLEGIKCILTAQDVPGLNGFGIAIPDQPVLCDKKVRYLGDPVALVIGETEKQVVNALNTIKVDYEPLEVVDDPLKALEPNAPLIHEQGNVLHHVKTSVGNPDMAFKDAYLVVENTYTTSWQEHAFLETEGGFGVPNGDGGVTIYCPAQYCYRDRQQLAKILNLPEEKIVIVSSPVGGAFGGKDDINVQALLALGALKTNRPVKIHLDREESFIAGIKRQPFSIKMRTAVDKTGEFLAQDVYVVCDTGAYASLGAAIMSFGLENCCGAYYFPNVQLEGYCVYTNNPISGEFRGFGNNQIHFALESQIDIISRHLNIDPLEIRKINCIKPGKRHSHGHSLHSAIGANETLKAAEGSNLWKNRQNFKKLAEKPWIRRGIGIALCQHGNGLGKGLPDKSTAAVEILKNGTFQVGVSTEDLGQGSLTTMAIIAAEVLNVGIEKITVINANTSLVPDSGSCTASRSTYLVGNAVKKSAEKMKEQLLALGANILHAPREKVKISDGKVIYENNAVEFYKLAEILCSQGINKVYHTEAMPETDLDYEIGLHYIQSYLTQVVGVEVNMLTGKTDVIVTEVFPDAGKVINLLGYEGQVEGGTVMGMGYALTEKFIVAKGQPMTQNYQTYILPTVNDIPEIHITPVEVLEESGPFGAKGFGETTSIAVTPAILNAIADAIGVRVFDLPADSETVYRLLESKQEVFKDLGIAL